MSTDRPRTECEEIVRRLWPHLDGALPDTERQRVVAHLEACEGCRSHYDFASAFLHAVRDASTDETTFAALRERVTRALGEAPPSR